MELFGHRHTQERLNYYYITYDEECTAHTAQLCELAARAAPDKDIQECVLNTFRRHGELFYAFVVEFAGEAAATFTKPQLAELFEQYCAHAYGPYALIFYVRYVYCRFHPEECESTQVAMMRDLHARIQSYTLDSVRDILAARNRRGRIMHTF